MKTGGKAGVAESAVEVAVGLGKEKALGKVGVGAAAVEVGGELREERALVVVGKRPEWSKADVRGTEVERGVGVVAMAVVVVVAMRE